MRIEPYLFFDGRCEEAIEFYRRTLGAEVTMLMRFRDAPDPPPPGMIAPGSEDKIMHASLRIGETNVMASDGRCMGTPSFQGVSLSLTVADEAEAERVFAALADRLDKRQSAYASIFHGLVALAGVRPDAEALAEINQNTPAEDPKEIDQEWEEAPVSFNNSGPQEMGGPTGVIAKIRASNRSVDREASHG